MGMLGEPEMAAETVNPVRWLAEKGRFLFVLRFIVFVMASARHVIFLFLRLPGLIEDGGIKAAVEINIRLHKKMIGEHLPAVAEKHGQNAVGPGMAGPPGRGTEPSFPA